MKLQKLEQPLKRESSDVTAVNSPLTTIQQHEYFQQQQQQMQFQCQQFLQMQMQLQLQMQLQQQQTQLVPFQIMVPMQLNQFQQNISQYSPEIMSQLQQQYQQFSNQQQFQQQFQNQNNLFQKQNGNINQQTDIQNGNADTLNNIPEFSSNQINIPTASTINIFNPKTPLEIKQNSNQICTELKQGSKKKNKDQNNIPEQQIIQTDIWKKDNLRPHTGHVPTNFMNILIPYLLKIWRDKIPCKKGITKKEVDKCDCEICKEFSLLRKMKANRKNVSLYSFCQLWKNNRIRVVSEDFINNNSFISIMNHQGYRTSVTRISLLLCLKYFQKNVKNPQQFYKLSD